MSSVNKPQRLFLTHLFSTLMLFQGKATFRNLSRYSRFSERTFSRWYQRNFSFLTFNTFLHRQFFINNECIAAIDASFVSKSGKMTEGLAQFYNGARSIAEKGLEISLICIIDIKSNTAYSVDAKQTIDDNEKEDKSDEKNKTRVDLYIEQVQRVAPNLLKSNITYLAADAFYSKVKFVTAVVDSGLEMIGKLRIDANLCWLYEGEQSGKGRPKKYDGKVDIHNHLDLFTRKTILDNGLKLYSNILYSHSLKMKINVVVVEFVRSDKIGHIILFSTDLGLVSEKILSHYQSRFQIEFIFRDAKQYTGMTHCQSRKSIAIENHVNASLTSLNLLKIEDRNEKCTQDKSVISIASWKRRKYNQHLVEKVIKGLGFSMKSEKVTSVYRELRDYGVIGF